MASTQYPDNGLHISVEQLIAMRHTLALAQTNTGTQQIGLTRIPGQSRGRRHGSGVDFEDLRLYQQGDDVRHIDWNATARLGDTYLKRYREERERLCIVLVDLRASTVFGSHDKLKSVAACELAASVAWLASARDYKVGAVVAAPGSTQATRPRSSSNGALDALGLMARQHSSLIEYWQQTQNADEDSNANATSETLDEAMQLVLHALTKGGRAIVITGGADPGQTYTEVAQHLAPQSQLLVYYMRDPIETTDHRVPAGLYPFRTTQDSGVFSSSVARTSALNNRRSEQEQRVVSQLSVHHTPVYPVTSTDPPPSLIAPLLHHDFL